MNQEKYNSIKRIAQNFVISEVLMLIVMKSALFCLRCDACSLVEVFQCFRETCYVQFSGVRFHACWAYSWTPEMEAIHFSTIPINFY
jgi:hypothetical protein